MASMWPIVVGALVLLVLIKPPATTSGHRISRMSANCGRESFRTRNKNRLDPVLTQCKVDPALVVGDAAENLVGVMHETRSGTRGSEVNES